MIIYNISTSDGSDCGLPRVIGRPRSGIVAVVGMVGQRAPDHAFAVVDPEGPGQWWPRVLSEGGDACPYWWEKEGAFRAGTCTADDGFDHQRYAQGLQARRDFEHMMRTMMGGALVEGVRRMFGGSRRNADEAVQRAKERAQQRSADQYTVENSAEPVDWGTDLILPPPKGDDR